MVNPPFLFSTTRAGESLPYATPDCVITHGLLSTYLPSHLDDGNDDDDDDGGGGDDEGKNGANKCSKREHETQDIK